ncbi:hypothetical protein NEOLEDRAFT_1093646 [Neolentinus lepideus HHB14362 ss-1]|uniref:Uncharacterized protein n=1 Tax=Neolentinus lepideus HHB14362 ss-1 TaxID=1314782 RepID=A0A165S8K6_9AGAM|nr:hypothetical protein NEOLEDRAFT_1093646 [Neolentinus lepideus HHB14362 ss-1]
MGHEPLARLRAPIQEELEIDADLRLSIDMYLAVTTTAKQVYEQIRVANQRRDPNIKMLSYKAVKKAVAELTRIFPIKKDCCIKNCIAYTGEFEDYETCPLCDEARYQPQPPNCKKKKIPRQTFTTVPLGPQLQALWRTHDGAAAMKWHRTQTQKIINELNANDDCLNNTLANFDDVLCGREYIQSVRDGTITETDMVLMLSTDGAQLYKSKISDFWVYIWIVIDHSPDRRYKKKHVLPGSFIPGPNKPKMLDSFLFTGLHHVAALQKEGLPIWDAETRTVFICFLFLLLALADAPGMASINGLVGSIF